MMEEARMCSFPVLLQGAWESPDPPQNLRNKILCYFQSRKKSGGGECEIQKQGGQILVCFAQEEVRQRVLSQKIHELDLAEKGTLKLEVSLYETTDPANDNAPKKEIISKKALGEGGQGREMEVQQDYQTKNVTLKDGPAGEAPHAEKDILDYPQKSSQVILENVEENIHLDTLTLLVDNISALSGDSTFHIEQINEKKAAVVTFQQSTAAANFIKQCSTNYRFWQYGLTARLLELTHVIKVENISAATSRELLTLYFESPKHGGGQVTDIQMLPTEDSALVTFGDSQVPQWDAGKGNAIKKLKNIMRNCLERAEMLSLKSISFPAIGTGGFNFPNYEVAKCMFKEILMFSRKKNFKFLQKVHVLLHPKDKENIKAFTKVFRSEIADILKTEPPSNEEMAVTGSFGSLSTSASGTNEMQIGSITFQSVTGNIVMENTDVIVNVTNEKFTSKLGVSKAILEAAGPEIEAECARLASQPHNGFVTTKNGKLPCKKIIHLAPCSSIKTQVSKVLQECEAKQYASVAFPVLGTGQERRSPDEAAEEIINAVAYFAGKELPRYLKLVKVVVFQPHMQKSFFTILKNKEGCLIDGKSPVKKKSSTVLEKKIETSSFELCGENRKKVEEAEAWLRKLVFKEQTEKCIVDDLIYMFADAEIKRLNDLQKRLHIVIHMNKMESLPFILLSGITRDVLTAYTEIQNLLKKLTADQEKKSKAELVQDLVEWQYCANGNVFVAFDSLSNLDLEDAKISKKKHIQVQIKGRNYTADLNKMCVVNSQGKSMKIKRVGKDEGKLLERLPEHWEDMKGSHAKLVPLQPTAGEYKDVEKKFRIGCPKVTIEKIERVQNPYLWRAYQVKKKEIDTQNGHEKNERTLFHGTPHSTLVPIYQTGFNRSYAGKNAATIGNGTYFAVSSNYSAHDMYSTPDRNARKYMYVARVLTGDYCMGRLGLIVPPPKNRGGFVLYDSVTNNMNQPSVFVIFHDAQAYPEYLITFRR